VGVTFAARDGSISGHFSRIRMVALNAITCYGQRSGCNWRMRLVSLEIDRINEAIGKIAEMDDSLGTMLSKLASKFAYTELFRALQPRERCSGKGSL
jgi:hypothetical protein